MGGGQGKSQGPAVKAVEKKPTSSQLRKEKLNPKDYVISKRTGEAIVKEDGTIRGEQFNIEECEDCDIFLFDHIATAFVDDCRRCRLFIGPVESSIFFRNCTDCDIVVACQQLRTRDCVDCRLSLFVGTEPIIESSRGMQFACFDYFYFSLREQLEMAGLKVLNNKWWQVYDFSKNVERPNWSLLPQQVVPTMLRTPQHTSITQEELDMDRVVPLTLGSRPRPSEESCFVLFLPQSEVILEGFLSRASKSPGWSLCRTRSTSLAADRLKSLFAFGGAKELPKVLVACKGKDVTGVEVCGAGIHVQVQQSLASLGAAAGTPYVRIVPEAETHPLAKAFFEIWKDEI